MTSAEARLEHHKLCEAVNKGDAWGTGGLTMAMVLIKLAQLDEIIRKEDDNGN
jgi:hypothetical protein